MTKRSTFYLYRDIWKAGREGSKGIHKRQTMRLNEIIQYARRHSKYYADLYRDMPQWLDNPCQLPVFTKQQLMLHFDEWITDPAINRRDVEEFVSDSSLIGKS